MDEIEKYKQFFMDFDEFTKKKYKKFFETYKLYTFSKLNTSRAKSKKSEIMRYTISFKYLIACELKVFNKRITLPYGCMLSYSCQTKKDKNHTKELLHV